MLWTSSANAGASARCKINSFLSNSIISKFYKINMTSNWPDPWNWQQFSCLRHPSVRWWLLVSLQLSCPNPQIRGQSEFPLWYDPSLITCILYLIFAYMICCHQESLQPNLSRDYSLTHMVPLYKLGTRSSLWGQAQGHRMLSLHKLKKKKPSVKTYSTYWTKHKLILSFPL